MDMYFEVQTFRSFKDVNCWHNFKCVRIDLVWRDVKKNRLILLLIDKYVSSNIIIIYFILNLTIYIIYALFIFVQQYFNLETENGGYCA